MTKFILILAAIAVVAPIQVHCQVKLRISILYESLCPDSIRFINNQLYPNYKQLADYIDILFVPFGKSNNVNGGESFVCQHGPEECSGNKIQSCALHQIPDQQATQVSYVNCQMDFAAERTGQVCIESHGINWPEVQNCYNSILGTRLQLLAEERTFEFQPTFVPTMIYNGVFDQDLQDRSLDDFVGVVCEQINNVAPVCASRN